MPFIWQLIDLLLLFHRWCPFLPFLEERWGYWIFHTTINFFQGYDGFHFHNAKNYHIFNLHSYPAVCIYSLLAVTKAMFCCVLIAASASSSGHPETPVTRGIMTSPYGMRDHTHFTHIQPPQVRGNHKHIMLAIICMFRGTSVNGGSVVLSQIK